MKLRVKNKTMKILIINKTIGLGSAGKIVEDLYAGIVSSGNICRVAYAKKKDNKIPTCDCIKIGFGFDRLVHFAFSRVFGNHAFYSKLVTKKFIKQIKIFKPDIVHIHSLYGYYINMELLLKTFAKMNIAIVSTLHCCWDFTGHCCYFDYLGCDQWKKDCSCCPQKNSYPKAFFDNTARNFNKKSELYNRLSKCVIVTPSKWLKDLVAESSLKKIKTKVIYNGINLFDFKPQNDFFILDKYGILRNKPYILSVANIWEPRKGLRDIYEFAAINSSNFQIVIVGLNRKELKDLPNNIIGIQRTTNRYELFCLYYFATVLFNPTYEDNYPTVNLESIACHTPVVAYNTGGCKETIQYGRYGLIIEKKDFNALLTYANNVLTGEVKIDFGDLSWMEKKSMVQNYLEVYTSLLQNNIKKRVE